MDNKILAAVIMIGIAGFAIGFGTYAYFLNVGTAADVIEAGTVGATFDAECWHNYIDYAGNFQRDTCGNWGLPEGIELGPLAGEQTWFEFNDFKVSDHIEVTKGFTPTGNDVRACLLMTQIYEYNDENDCSLTERFQECRFENDILGKSCDINDYINTYEKCDASLPVPPYEIRNVELPYMMQVKIWGDSDCDNVYAEGIERLIYDDYLSELLPLAEEVHTESMGYEAKVAPSPYPYAVFDLNIGTYDAWLPLGDEAPPQAYPPIGAGQRKCIGVQFHIPQGPYVDATQSDKIRLKQTIVIGQARNYGTQDCQGIIDQMKSGGYISEADNIAYMPILMPEPPIP